MGIENIVRPYQLPQNTSPQVVLKAAERAVAPVLLQIGRGGSGKTFSESTSLTISFYCDAAAVELF